MEHGDAARVCNRRKTVIGKFDIDKPAIGKGIIGGMKQIGRAVDQPHARQMHDLVGAPWIRPTIRPRVRAGSRFIRNAFGKRRGAFPKS